MLLFRPGQPSHHEWRKQVNGAARKAQRFYPFIRDGAQYFEDRQDGTIYGPYVSYHEAKIKMAELKTPGSVT